MSTHLYRNISIMFVLVTSFIFINIPNANYRTLDMPLSIAQNRKPLSYSVDIQPGPEGLDTWITSTNPTARGPNTNYLTCEDDTGPIKAGRFLLCFNLSTVPSNATVVSSALTLCPITSPLGSPTISLHRLKVSWYEPDACWKYRKSPTQWTSWGAYNTSYADSEKNASATATVTSSGNKTLNVTDLAKGWVNRSYQNFGVLVRVNDDTMPTMHRFVQFYSSDETTAISKRPKLTVNYTLPINVPSAPQNITASANSSDITLTWQAPISDGGSPITNYRIHRGNSSGGEAFLAEIGNLFTYSDVGLSPGTYYYTISAKNSIGEGMNSTEASATINPSPTPPSEPCNPQAVANGTIIMLSWQEPASDGGSLVTNYSIYRGKSSGGENILCTIGNETAWNDTGLMLGTYYYMISASNSIDEGPCSCEVSATVSAPPGTPSAPRNPHASVSGTKVSLTWETPISNGSSLVTHYRIYRGNISGGEIFISEIGAALMYDDTGLSLGTYYYTISAKNQQGEGPQSSETNATVTISGVPTAPRNLVASAIGNTITLTWQVPASDNGSVITNYEVYRGIATNGESFIEEISDILTYDDTGLAAGTYYYKVSAKNAIGEGPTSNEDSATIIIGSKILKHVDISPVSKTMKIGESATFTATAYDTMDNEITDTFFTWNVTPSSIGTVACGVFMPIHEGTATITASCTYNSISKSANATVLITGAPPPGSPDEPRNLKANAGNSKVILTWLAPESDGGSPITNYRIYRGQSASIEAFLIEIGNFTAYTDTNLTNSMTYYYMVCAKNKAGEGNYSAEVSATPNANVPKRPGNVTAVGRNGYIIVSWSPVTGASGYNLMTSDNKGGPYVKINDILITSTTYTDMGLTNGHTYYYVVTALNSYGESDISNEISATPTSGSVDNFSLIFILVLIFIIIAIVAITAVIASRKRKKAPETETKEAPIVKPEAQKELAISTIAVKSGKCYICNKMYKKDASIVACRCGKKYHKHCADNIKACPECGRTIRTETTIIDEVFLIYNDGRLIRHETRRIKPDMDQDILSSMLVAVQSFIKDSFKGEKGNLDEMKFGEMKLLIGRGKWVTIMAVLAGEEIEPLRPQIARALDDIESKYPDILKDWNGHFDKITALTDNLKDLINGKYR